MVLEIITSLDFSRELEFWKPIQKNIKEETDEKF